MEDALILLIVHKQGVHCKQVLMINYQDHPSVSSIMFLQETVEYPDVALHCETDDKMAERTSLYKGKLVTSISIWKYIIERS